MLNWWLPCCKASTITHAFTAMWAHVPHLRNEVDSILISRVVQKYFRNVIVILSINAVIQTTEMVCLSFQGGIYFVDHSFYFCRMLFMLLCASVFVALW